MAGDAPLIPAETLKQFRQRHRREKSQASILTAELADAGSYGRILRDSAGRVTGIRETLDADEKEKRIREVNSSIYFFQAPKLFEVLKKIRPANRKNEYYLTDAIALLAESGEGVKAYCLAHPGALLGINDRRDLVMAAKEIWNRNIVFHLDRGVTIVSPENTYIEPDVRIGADTIVYPFTYIEKNVTIGKNCQIGPFCKIRSGTTVKDRSVVGSFVEIVRSSIGENSRVKHLTYLGDTHLGRNVNVGAGTITANFDGKNTERRVASSIVR
jgi:bifunctional UDP-N-acetylglucosamine pyrophosphorylase/glucosamine-1-phosphate N-acetyltransferase